MTITDTADQYQTYDGRLASFQCAQPVSKRRASNIASKAPKSIKWPHSSLLPEQMAKAGFFHYPTQENPDNVVCFLCRKSMDGWEEDDDPLEEHFKHSPNCGWAIVASIDAGDTELSQQDPFSSRMIEARKATFGDRWPHENKKGWKCKVKQLVDAGWIYTPTPESDDMATCAYCSLALDGWEPSDKPLDEHQKRSENCTFFALRIEHQDNTKISTIPAKIRKPRASKVSRISTQSSYTIASEDLSVADLPAEDGDSVLTTATNATVTSKSGRKVAKGKKPTKGKRAKNKDQSLEVSVDMEPEDADYEVKVEQSNAVRGKKRTSEDMYETSTLVDVQPPPAKRRGTRNTRGSVAVVDDLASIPHIPTAMDVVMAQVDDIVLKPAAPSRKKGRPSKAKSQRNISSASTASKASLRITMADDSEIDRALEADLERPLTDGEDQELSDVFPKTRRESQSKKSTAGASVAPVRKITRGSKIHTAYEMFTTGELPIDESKIDAELKTMELEEAVLLPKAKAAKGKQSRKPSAKQQAAAKRAMKAEETETGLIEKESSIADEQENGSNVATSQNLPEHSMQSSAILPNEGKDNMNLGPEEIHDAADDSDGSVASISTVVKGGFPKRSSSMRKPKTTGKAASRNIKEGFQKSLDQTSTQQEVEDVLQKKRGGRSKKIVEAEDVIIVENSPHIPSVEPQESLVQPLASKASKVKGGLAKGKAKVWPATDPPSEPLNQQHKSPKLASKELTPSLSPQSSDAENQPPSSKPSTVKQAGVTSQVSRIPLEACTPMRSPTKRNIIAGLQSAQPWTAVELDEILMQSPSNAQAEKENVMSMSLVAAIGNAKKGDLTSPEKRMTVEEWIMHNASLAEEKLKSECERMVSIFEREGGRAMRVLEGIVCAE